jgi:phosphatidate cytidylyltransferase
MVRLLSGFVLLAVFAAAIWFLAPLPLLAVAEVVLMLAVAEYARLTARVGAAIPVVPAAAGAGVVCAALAVLQGGAEVPVMAVGLAIGALAVGAGRIAPEVPIRVFAAVFPTIYLGLPLGALVAVHKLAGREAVLLLLLTVIVSDTAQLYTGRLLGRHLMTPAISPKKTIEGAVGGFVAGTAVLVLVGRWWLPQAVSPWWLAGLGVAVVGFGILGDLFESLLKRSAGVKDSSSLIPGHGGVLDRIDSLLFAIPVYYIFLRYGLRVVA